MACEVVTYFTNWQPIVIAIILHLPLVPALWVYLGINDLGLGCKVGRVDGAGLLVSDTHG